MTAAAGRCEVTTSPCGAAPVIELNAGVRWVLACYRHGAGFVELAEARGVRVEQRPIGLLRDVLDHEGDADVIPITRAERAA
jgi:hypothetical protein